MNNFTLTLFGVGTSAGRESTRKNSIAMQRNPEAEAKTSISLSAIQVRDDISSLNPPGHQPSYGQIISAFNIYHKQAKAAYWPPLPVPLQFFHRRLYHLNAGNESSLAIMPMNPVPPVLMPPRCNVPLPPGARRSHRAETVSNIRYRRSAPDGAAAWWWRPARNPGLLPT